MSFLKILIKKYLEVIQNYLIRYVFLFIFALWYMNFALGQSNDLSLKLTKINGINVCAEKLFVFKNFKSFYFFEKNILYKNKKNTLIKFLNFDNHLDANKLIYNEKYILFYGKNTLILFDKFKKCILWKKTFDESIYLDPVMCKNFVFIILGHNKILAFNADTGVLNWNFKYDIEDFFICSNNKFLQSDKYLFYIYSNKRVLLIRKDNGTLLTNFNISDRDELNIHGILSIKNIKLYNKILYISYDNGTLLAFNTFDGIYLWKKSNLNYKKIFIYKNFILAFKTNGYFVLLNKFNGNKIQAKRFKNLKPINFIQFHDNDILFFISKGKLFYIKIESEKFFLKKGLYSNIKAMKSNFKNILVLSNNNKLYKLYVTHL